MSLLDMFSNPQTAGLLQLGASMLQQRAPGGNFGQGLSQGLQGMYGMQNQLLQQQYLQQQVEAAKKKQQQSEALSGYLQSTVGRPQQVLPEGVMGPPRPGEGMLADNQLTPDELQGLFGGMLSVDGGAETGLAGLLDIYKAQNKDRSPLKVGNTDTSIFLDPQTFQPLAEVNHPLARPPVHAPFRVNTRHFVDRDGNRVIEFDDGSGKLRYEDHEGRVTERLPPGYTEPVQDRHNTARADKATDMVTAEFVSMTRPLDEIDSVLDQMQVAIESDNPAATANIWRAASDTITAGSSRAHADIELGRNFGGVIQKALNSINMIATGQPSDWNKEDMLRLVNEIRERYTGPARVKAMEKARRRAKQLEKRGADPSEVIPGEFGDSPPGNVILDYTK